MSKIVGGIGIVGGGETESLNNQGVGFYNDFFYPFTKYENCSIRTSCAYSKSKIKAEVTIKQNLEHFKMTH